MVTLLFSCLVFICVNLIFKNDKPENTPNIESAWVAPSGGGTDLSLFPSMQNFYDSNSSFYIYNDQEFLYFMGYANFYVTGANLDGSFKYTYPFTFYGKNVYLMNNVSVSTNTQPMHFFYGTFNGQGFTIDYNYTYHMTNDTDTIGMFCRLNYGAICNTKFKDVSLYLEDGSSEYSGGIVGTNYGIITRCIVENAYFKSDRYKSNCAVGTIAGINSGSSADIYDCKVQGTYTLAGNGGNFASNPDGLYAYHFIAGENSGMIRNVVYCMSITKEHEKEDYKEHLVEPSGAGTGSIYTNVRDGFSYLDKSSAGYTDSSSVWYYATQYDSWPHLRTFTVFKTVTISGVNCSVSPSKIYIPSNAYGTFDSDTTTITIYNQNVTCSVNTCHYEISDLWTCSSATSYTATFIKPTRTVNVYHNKDGSKTRVGSFTLSCGSSVSVSLNAGGYLKSYKSCNVGSVSYTVNDNKYCITRTSVSNGTAIHSDTEVIIYVSLKQYNITFG